MNQIKTKVKTYRPVIVKKGEDAGKKVGMRFGGYVKKIATNSVKKRKKGQGPSPAGQPVSSVTGAYKKFIRFEYDANTRTLFIGPELLPGKTAGAPAALEHGGSVVADVLPEQPQQLLDEGKKFKRVRKRIKISEHPTMQLALEKALPELPKLWAGIIRR